MSDVIEWQEKRLGTSEKTPIGGNQRKENNSKKSQGQGISDLQRVFVCLKRIVFICNYLVKRGMRRRVQ